MTGNVSWTEAALDWYSWGGWSVCSASCGPGLRWRRRACLRDPRTCPLTSRPNSLYYEKSQVQECHLQPCSNQTARDRGALATPEVGLPIGVSAVIIACVFLLAKTLHCLSKRTKSCCRRLTQTSDRRNLNDLSSPGETVTVRPTSPVSDTPPGPVFITITQEMITGGVDPTLQGNRSAQPAGCPPDPVINPTRDLPRSPTTQIIQTRSTIGIYANHAENATLSSIRSSTSNPAPVSVGGPALIGPGVDPIITESTDHDSARRQSASLETERNLGAMNSGGHAMSACRGAVSADGNNLQPMSSGRDIVGLQTAGLGIVGTELVNPGDEPTNPGGELTNPPTTDSDSIPPNVEEMASTADTSICEPPSYESLFPLFKRNQTL